MLRLPDPERRYAEVALDSPGLSGPCRYRRGGWERAVGRPRTDRIEYQFRTVTPGGRVGYELDPAESRQVTTDFGRRSVWEAPTYASPRWLDQPAAAGQQVGLELPSALTHPLPVTVWTPEGLADDQPAPLLWCHDGPAYAAQASLIQWAAAHVAAETLPAFRLVLAGPQRRMQTYSGSPRYLRSVDLAIEALRQRYAVAGPLAVMGASLGGLTSLLVALRRPDVGCVLSQSGSFFWERGPERDWPWFDRVVRLVDDIKTGNRRHPRTDLLVGMTCGRHESNHDNNLAVVDALRRQGLRVEWSALADLHSYTAWRDSLDPVWPRLLRETWAH